MLLLAFIVLAKADLIISHRGRTRKITFVYKHISQKRNWTQNISKVINAKLK